MVSIVFTVSINTSKYHYIDTIDINAPLTCASVSCVLLVLSDLRVQ